MVSRRILDPPPNEIFVLDTALLIKIKQLVKVDEQWALLDAMMQHVRAGEICFPRQVATELTGQRWPDAPGAWVGHARGLVCHHEPADGCVAQVLAMTPELIDPDATGVEPADPYVVALALELCGLYPSCRVMVASDDRVDRPPVRLSVKTACDRLNIEFCEPAPFIAWVRGRMASGAQGARQPRRSP
jgi:hypothetical protein